MKTNTIKTKKGSVTLLEPGIIHLELNENVQWDLEDAKETHRANLELSKGGKFFVYMNAKRFFVPTKEAQKFISNKECTDHRIGAVFVVKNTGLQVLAKLFQKFFKSKSPTHIFKSEAEALKWMRMQYREISGK